MCALRRGITCSRSIATDPINCNRSDVKQISQKPAEPIGTASCRTASAIPANLIEMPVGSVLVSDSRVIGCWVGCP